MGWLGGAFAPPQPIPQPSQISVLTQLSLALNNFFASVSQRQGSCARVLKLTLFHQV